jgi:hypothetical protein
MIPGPPAQDDALLREHHVRGAPLGAGRAHFTLLKHVRNGGDTRVAYVGSGNNDLYQPDHDFY